MYENSRGQRPLLALFCQRPWLETILAPTINVYVQWKPGRDGAINKLEAVIAPINQVLTWLLIGNRNAVLKMFEKRHTVVCRLHRSVLYLFSCMLKINFILLMTFTLKRYCQKALFYSGNWFCEKFRLFFYAIHSIYTELSFP